MALGIFSQTAFGVFNTLMSDHKRQINILTGFKHPPHSDRELRFTGSSQINHVNIFIDNQKIKCWWLLWEILCCGSDSVSHFHALYPHLCTLESDKKCLFWQAEWVPGVINLVPQGATQSKDPPRCEARSLLICISDRFTELLQVGCSSTALAGWELQTGVPAAVSASVRRWRWETGPQACKYQGWITNQGKWASVQGPQSLQGPHKS